MADRHLEHSRHGRQKAREIRAIEVVAGVDAETRCMRRLRSGRITSHHFGFVTHTLGSFKRTGASVPVLTPSNVSLSLSTGDDVTLHLI